MNYCIFCLISRGISNTSLDWIKSKWASYFMCFVVLQNSEHYRKYWSLPPNTFQNPVYWHWHHSTGATLVLTELSVCPHTTNKHKKPEQHILKEQFDITGLWAALMVTTEGDRLTPPARCCFPSTCSNARRVPGELVPAGRGMDLFSRQHFATRLT